MGVPYCSATAALVDAAPWRDVRVAVDVLREYCDE